MLFAEFRDLGRGVFLTDVVLFLAVLVLCKLFCYNINLCYFQKRSAGLWGQLVIAAVVFGPLSMATILTVRHGLSVWAGPDKSSAWALLGLALAIRPTVVLFKPISCRRSLACWLKQDWGKVVFGALIGTTLIVSGALLVNVRGISRLGAVADGALYLGLMTVFAVGSQQRTNRRLPQPLTGSPRRREKLLLVGNGIQLTAFMAAFTAMRERRLEIVGALSLRRGLRDNLVGGVAVLGTVGDAPDVVRAMQVSRIVVIDADMTDTELDALRLSCGLAGEQALRVDFLRPVLQLWRADEPSR
jgi:hypothetical protein